MSQAFVVTLMKWWYFGADEIIWALNLFHVKNKLNHKFEIKFRQNLKSRKNLQLF